MTSERQFPIMTGRGTKWPCPSRIPWEAIAPYEGQAQENHQQSLERLAERGGLDPVEAFFVMTGRSWHEVLIPVDADLERDACAFLEKVVRDRDELVKERDALRGEIEKLSAGILQLTKKPRPEINGSAVDSALALVASMGLQVAALQKALYEECRGVACGPECAGGGYRKCSGCDNRAKAAYGPGWGDVVKIEVRIR